MKVGNRIIILRFLIAGALLFTAMNVLARSSETDQVNNQSDYHSFYDHCIARQILLENNSVPSLSGQLDLMLGERKCRYFYNRNNINLKSILINKRNPTDTGKSGAYQLDNLPRYGFLTSASINGLGNVILGDFDGDGNLDAIASSPAFGEVVFQKGNGDGTFASPQVIYSGGVETFAIAVLDVNGDGHKDLVIGDRQSPIVHVYIGNGDGTFAAGGSVNLGGVDVLGFEVMDYNEDGVPDIAIIPESGTGFLLLPGLGNGGFGPPVTMPLPYEVSDVVETYLNAGSTPSLLVADFTDLAIKVYTADASGQFVLANTLPVDNYPIDIALTENNQAGVKQLVVNEFTDSNIDVTGEIQVLDEDSTGDFPQSVTYQTRAQGVGLVAKDINSDGIPDLVLNNLNDDSVTVLDGTSSGIYTGNMSYKVGHAPYGIDVGDVNNDGMPDLVSTSYLSPWLVTQENRGNGVFSTVPRYFFGNTIDPNTGAPPLNNSNLADINNDGYPDVAVYRYSYVTGYSYIVSYLNNGKGVWIKGPSTQIPDTVQTFDHPVLYDLNGDGNIDIVINAINSAGYPSGFIVGYGDGTGKFTLHLYGKSDANSTYLRIFVADVNNDGLPDVLMEDFQTQGVDVYLQNGEHDFVHEGEYNGYPAFNAMALADLNNDGFKDAILGDVTAPDILVLPGDGAGGFGAPITIPAPAPAYTIQAKDLNDDGQIDLVYSASGVPGVNVALNMGGYNFASPINYPTDGTCGYIRVADLNGDGKPDLICTNGGLTILYGNGDGSFGAPHTTVGIEGDDTKPYVADINGDGKPDIATATLFNFNFPAIYPIPAYAKCLAVFFQRPVADALPPTVDPAYYYNGAGVITVPVQGVDETGASVQFQIADNPSSGTATLTGPDGTYLNYIPDPNEFGYGDIVGVSANSANGESNLGNIFFYYGGQGEPDQPVASPVDMTAPAAVSVTGAFNATDPAGLPLLYSAGSPSNGSVFIGSRHSGVFVYRSDPTFDGPEIFNYQACNTYGICSSSTVNVAVVSANPPAAGTLEIATEEDRPVTSNLLGSDPDGNNLTYEIKSQPQHGTVNLIGMYTGKFTYNPNQYYSGNDTFLYTVKDAYHSATGTANITINAVLPHVSDISNQTVYENQMIGPVPFSVSGEGNLTVTSSSSNTSLIPSNAIDIASSCGGGGNCGITIYPSHGISGKSTIMIHVQDPAGHTAGSSFVVTVRSPGSSGGGSGSGGGGGAIGPLELLLIALLTSLITWSGSKRRMRRR